MTSATKQIAGIALGAAVLVPASLAGAQGGVTGGGSDGASGAYVVHQVRVVGSTTTFTKLRARQVPSGATVTVHCRPVKRGCPAVLPPVGKVKNGTVNLTKLLRSAHLKPRAVVEVIVAMRDGGGKCVRFTMRRLSVPRVTTYATAPVGRIPDRCG